MTRLMERSHTLKKHKLTKSEQSKYQDVIMQKDGNQINAVRGATNDPLFCYGGIKYIIYAYFRNGLENIAEMFGNMNVTYITFAKDEPNRIYLIAGIAILLLAGLGGVICFKKRIKNKINDD